MWRNVFGLQALFIPSDVSLRSADDLINPRGKVPESPQWFVVSRAKAFWTSSGINISSTKFLAGASKTEAAACSTGWHPEAWWAQIPTETHKKKVAESLHVFEDNISFSWFNGQLLSTYWFFPFPFYPILLYSHFSYLEIEIKIRNYST